MFTLPSLPKILVILALVVVGWMVFSRWSGRSGSGREKGRLRRDKPGRSAQKVEEMRACPACGTYVAPGAKSCGRADCPH